MVHPPQQDPKTSKDKPVENLVRWAHKETSPILNSKDEAKEVSRIPGEGQKNPQMLVPKGKEVRFCEHCRNRLYNLLLELNAPILPKWPRYEDNDEHRNTYDEELQKHIDDDKYLNRSYADPELECGPIHVARGIKLTQKVLKAEIRLKDWKKEAKIAVGEALLCNMSDQSPHFVRVEVEGYSDLYKHAEILTCNVDHIRNWTEDNSNNAYKRSDLGIFFALDN
ncbi:hypothetical protein P154DRAFT_577919 [Amniculicola lignicola CBS 123094]|uniref:Uncharacterized protein n=1 Tax=Amniculicola lignicola CBS 123094 TaxID=1392246 RepID=A0A6A5WAY3_9PLEO|nr:hypothetical protein P154DRAFT_577919 [Amniculicola lignicola CBS 123094]